MYAELTGKLFKIVALRPLARYAQLFACKRRGADCQVMPLRFGAPPNRKQRVAARSTSRRKEIRINAVSHYLNFAAFQPKTLGRCGKDLLCKEHCNTQLEIDASVHVPECRLFPPEAPQPPRKHQIFRVHMYKHCLVLCAQLHYVAQYPVPSHQSWNILFFTSRIDGHILRQGVCAFAQTNNGNVLAMS